MKKEGEWEVSHQEEYGWMQKFFELGIKQPEARRCVLKEQSKENMISRGV